MLNPPKSSGPPCAASSDCHSVVIRATSVCSPGCSCQRRLACFAQVGLNIHRAMLAEMVKTAVHFCTDRACPGSLAGILWPELLLGEALGKVLGNGERVPHYQGLACCGCRTRSRLVIHQDE